MSKIVFTPPGPDAPGYLRRTRAALKFSAEIKSDPKPETIDALVEMLLPFVTEPADRDEAKEALWDATQAQFLALLASLTGGAAPLP